MIVQREAVLARYCAERTVEHRNDVVAAYRDVCVRAAKKFKRSHNDRSDLEQVAAVGLIKAAQHYRHEMQTPFEAYAWIVIVGELMHEVRDHERMVRVPRALQTLEKRFLDVWERFIAANEREPSTGELAAAMGVTIGVVDELRALRRMECEPYPDADAHDAPQAVALLADRRGIAIEERIALHAALDGLGERERAIVLGTYGAGLTQTELGERLGLSQSHISKTLKRALRKLERRVA